MRVTGEEIQGHGQTYRLLRRIGQGGFGDVYLARATTQGGLTRTVAIKLLKDKAGPEGDVKVLDFGISKPGGMEREALTRRGPPGSRYYAPPEMFMGLPQGPTVDVYALGALSQDPLGFSQSKWFHSLSSPPGVAT